MNSDDELQSALRETEILRINAQILKIEARVAELNAEKQSLHVERIKLGKRPKDDRHGGKRHCSEEAPNQTGKGVESGTSRPDEPVEKRPKKAKRDCAAESTNDEMIERGFFPALAEKRGEDGALDSPDTFSFSHIKERTNQARKTKKLSMKVRVENPEGAANPHKLLDKILAKALQVLVPDPKNDPPIAAGLDISTSATPENEMSSFFLPVQNFSTIKQCIRDWGDQIEANAQSCRFPDLSRKTLSLELCAYWGFAGSGHNCSHKTPLGAFDVMAQDHYCLARAVAIGIAHHQSVKSVKCLLVNHKELQAQTLKILEDSGLDPAKQEYGMADVKKLQNMFMKHARFEGMRFRLVIVGDGRILFNGSPSSDLVMGICLENGHFYFVDKPHRKLHQKRRVCFDCGKTASFDHHCSACPKACMACLRAGSAYPCPQIGGETKICTDCFFTFPNLECYNYHKQLNGRKRTVCESKRICSVCGRTKYTKAPKIGCKCEQVLDSINSQDEVEEEVESCKRCKAVHDSEQGETCRIQPLAVPERQDYRLVVFDIETYLADDGEHVPNLVCCKTSCTFCLDNSQKKKKCLCGKMAGDWTFAERPESSVMEQFVNWLLKRKHDGTTTLVLSHNGAKYDVHFVLAELHRQGLNPKQNIELSIQGTKVFSAVIHGHGYNKVIFKDSCLFFLSSLRKLPQAFGFDTHVKGYFPYSVNGKDNFYTTLPQHPPINLYEPENLSGEERRKFEEFYEEVKDQPFNIGEELTRYCRDDVEVLFEAVKRFRATLKNLSGIDPFLNCSTIAGLALRVWRTSFLKADVLMNPPEKGYMHHQMQSQAAKKYFRFVEKKRGVKVRNACWADGEHSFDDGTRRYIDGVIYDINEKPIEAIEYLGCWFHGCRKCYKNRSTLLVGGLTAEELYQSLMRRVVDLAARYPGISITLVWECEFKQQLSKCEHDSQLYAQVDIATPMHPRQDALRGGRVEAYKHHHEFSEAEEPQFVDFVSLYPYSMKANMFPVGNPKLMDYTNFEDSPIYTLEEFQRLGIRGLIKCRVLPPRNLRIPVLPYRNKNGILTFPLCRSCSDRQANVKCDHMDLDRSFVSAFTHSELELAMEHGYTILRIFEAYNYSQWSRDLFMGYIDMFLKIKQEASGWPSNVNTCEEKAQYIQDYYDAEGVLLDKDAIRYDPCMRFIAKILLNSLWGKLSQRCDYSRVIYTKTAAEFANVMTSEDHRVMYFDHVKEDLDRIQVRPLNSSPPLTNNVIIACYVTSYARIHLYKALRQLNPNRLIYMDTDSILYTAQRGHMPFQTGSRAGQLSREFEGRRIGEVIVGGPKNYAISHTDEAGEGMKTIMKIRGFTLNFKAAQVLQFEIVKSMILGHYETHQLDLKRQVEEDDSTTTNSLCVPHVLFKRTRLSKIYTKNMDKRYRVAYTKGLVVKKHFIPYGYDTNVLDLETI